MTNEEAKNNLRKPIVVTYRLDGDASILDAKAFDSATEMKAFLLQEIVHLYDDYDKPVTIDWDYDVYDESFMRVKHGGNKEILYKIFWQDENNK